MKRPIAMLLALLLTAGLFAFVSCGEGKNYTVEVIETNGYKKLHFSEEEIERFNKDFEEQGWAIVEFEGIEESDFSKTHIRSYGEHGTLESFLKSTDLIAKCKLTNLPPSTYIAAIAASDSSNSRTSFTNGNLYTFEIEEIFYQSDLIKFEVDEKIRVWIRDWRVLQGGLESGMVLEQLAGFSPPTYGSFYVCLSLPEHIKNYDSQIISSVADMMLPRDYPFIAALGNDIYEFGYDFSEELLGNVYKGDFRIEEEDRTTVGLPLRAEIENFEEKLMAIIEKYKP